MVSVKESASVALPLQGTLHADDSARRQRPRFARHPRRLHRQGRRRAARCRRRRRSRCLRAPQARSGATRTMQQGVTRGAGAWRVGAIIPKANSHIGYKGLDLTGITRAEVLAQASARNDNVGGTIEVRTGSPTGPDDRPGTVNVPGGCGVRNRSGEPQTAGAGGGRGRGGAGLQIALKPTTGVHDVYFVFKNPAATRDSAAHDGVVHHAVVVRRRRRAVLAGAGGGGDRVRSSSASVPSTSRTSGGTSRRDARPSPGGSSAPTFSAFNYADYRQHYTSWLFDAAAYAVVVAAGGQPAIQLLQATLLALTLICVIVACRTRVPRAGAAAGVARPDPRRSSCSSRARSRARTWCRSPALAGCAWLVERAGCATIGGAAVVGRVRSSRCGATSTSSACSAWLLSASSRPAEMVRPASLTRREAVRARDDCRRMRRGDGWRTRTGGDCSHTSTRTGRCRQLLTIAELQPPPLDGLSRVLRVPRAVRGAACHLAMADGAALGVVSRRGRSPRSARGSCG